MQISFLENNLGKLEFEDMEKKRRISKKRATVDPLVTVTLANERGGRRKRKGNNDVPYLVPERLMPDNSEVPLELVINDPRGCQDGHILLVREPLKQSPKGKISLSPLPFLRLFTAFGRRPGVPKPPRVQSRWNLVKIPLRREPKSGPLKSPYKYKDGQPIEPQGACPVYKEYRRPLIPIDHKKKRRILHHFPITGDKRHMFKLLTPSGFYQRRRGGGWSCRRWIKRRWPRVLINHTKEEWIKALKQKEKKEKIEDEKFQSVFGEVWNGIVGLDQGILRETFIRLVKENERKTEKKQDMYDDWDLKVFNYIQRQTGDKINDAFYDPQVVTAKQMDLQRKYCKAMQRRKVFLDIIHPDEYNPYEYTGTALKYSDKNLFDPVKRDWLKDRREKEFFGEFVSKKHQSRETLKLANWPELEFKACMAGRVCCDEELIGERKHLAAVPEKWASHPVFYNKRWFSEFSHTAFPKGGKCCDGPRPADQKYADPPPWKGIGIVWDAPQKHQQKLQISEENPWL